MGVYEKNKIKIFFFNLFLMLTLFGCGVKEQSYINKLGHYKGLEYQQTAINVTEKDIDCEIEREMIPYTKTQDVKGKIQNNHIVVMKIEIRDPKHVKNDIILDAFEYIVDGTDKNFDKVLLGKCKDDYFEYYPEVLADMGYEQQMDYTIIILRAYKEVQPVLEDTFIREKTGYDSVTAYKKYIFGKVYQQYKELQKNKIMDELLNKVVEKTKFADIDKLYAEKLLELNNSYDAYANLYGQSREELLESLDIKDQELEENALKFVKEKLIVQEISRKENILISDKEFQVLALDYVKDLGYESIAEFENDCGPEFLKNEILSVKIKKFLLSNAVINNPDYEIK